MYGAFMAVGWIASRRVRDGTAADLIVAGRAMPFWVAALTMSRSYNAFTDKSIAADSTTPVSEITIANAPCRVVSVLAVKAGSD